MLSLPEVDTGPSKEAAALSQLRQKMAEREAALKEKKGRSDEHEALRRGSLGLGAAFARGGQNFGDHGSPSGADSESKIVDLADLAEVTGSPIHEDSKMGAFARRAKNNPKKSAYLPGTRETAL